MKAFRKAVWWGSVLALVVVLFSIRLIFRDEFGWALLFTIFALCALALFVAPPLAEALSGGLIGKLFAFDKGKVEKDHSKARWLVTQERFEEAVAEFRRALEGEPGNIKLRVEIAEIYSRDMKKFHAAISELEECLKHPLSPREAASILNRIADIHETDLRDPRAARAALSRILEAYPGTNAAERAAQRMAGIPQDLPPAE
jgi:tetratricopeptide (TPR) repeat protein